VIFCNAAPLTKIYTLSLHDALPIYDQRKIRDHRQWDEALGRMIIELRKDRRRDRHHAGRPDQQRITVRRLVGDEVRCEPAARGRSEEHTSELQSPCNLVCRLLLEKK